MKWQRCLAYQLSFIEARGWKENCGEDGKKSFENEMLLRNEPLQSRKRLLRSKAENGFYEAKQEMRRFIKASISIYRSHFKCCRSFRSVDEVKLRIS